MKKRLIGHMLPLARDLQVDDRLCIEETTDDDIVIITVRFSRQISFFGSAHNADHIYYSVHEAYI